MRGNTEGAMDAPGVAAGLRLQGELARADYHAHVTRTEPDFQPLGAAVAPGRVISEVGARYPLPGLFRFDADMRAYRDRTNDSEATGRMHRAALVGPAPALLPGIDRFRIESAYERHRASDLQQAWRIAFDGRGVDIRDWRLRGGLTWGNDLWQQTSSAHYGWRFHGEGPVSLRRFKGILGSSITFRQASRDDDWRVSAGLDWHSDTASGGWVMQLEYSRSAATARPSAENPRTIMLSIRLDGGAAALANAVPHTGSRAVGDLF